VQIHSAMLTHFRLSPLAASTIRCKLRLLLPSSSVPSIFPSIFYIPSSILYFFYLILERIPYYHCICFLLHQPIMVSSSSSFFTSSSFTLVFPSFFLYTLSLLTFLSLLHHHIIIILSIVWCGVYILLHLSSL
jgi:hypothetical protein